MLIVFLSEFFHLLSLGEWLIRIGLLLVLVAIFMAGFIKKKQFLTGLFSIYLIFFTGFGSYSRSLFTNMSSWSWSNGKVRYAFRGTGAFINKNDVITNSHVVAGCKSVAVSLVGNKTYEARVVAQDKKADLAVVRTNADMSFYSVLRNVKHVAGEKAFYPEYTSDAGVYFKKVSYVETDTDADTNKIELKTFGSRGGNSGSPIYDSKGYMIGVVHSLSIINMWPISSSYGENLVSVSKFLGNNKIPYLTHKGDLDLFERQPGYLEQLGVGVLCGS